jgi:hypothetical protein
MSEDSKVLRSCNAVVGRPTQRLRRRVVEDLHLDVGRVSPIVHRLGPERPIGSEPGYVKDGWRFYLGVRL